MKIATWNVNSIRTRLDHVTNWLLTNPVDVLCLQETKVVDTDFPRSHFEQLGYHVYVSGQKSYNGVALIARSPLEDVTIGFTPLLDSASSEMNEFMAIVDEQKRAIAAVFNGIRIINLYVPNGSEIGSEKYAYKLNWLQVLLNYIRVSIDKYTHLCICGDFNIALEDRDFHNPKTCANQIMSSTAERTALANILDLGLADAFRKFTAEGGHFSWWDYRGGSFPKNKGWRIDHCYLTPELYEKCNSCIIDSNPRQWTQPSDHAPVIVEFSR